MYKLYARADNTLPRCLRLLVYMQLHGLPVCPVCLAHQRFRFDLHVIPIPHGPVGDWVGGVFSWSSYLEVMVPGGPRDAPPLSREWVFRLPPPKPGD